MEGRFKYKVPGGKLISVSVRYSKSIERVQLCGDFFMHPEECVFEIEDALAGLPANSDEGLIAAAVRQCTEDNKVEMIGIDPMAIAHAVKMAMQ